MRAGKAARDAWLGRSLASASIVAALLSLVSVALVAALSLTEWMPYSWLGPASALGGLFSWAAGVAFGGIALGSTDGRRAVLGLALCVVAAACFALMVLALEAVS